MTEYIAPTTLFEEDGMCKICGINHPGMVADCSVGQTVNPLECISALGRAHRKQCRVNELTLNALKLHQRFNELHR